jgi:hypothetical protein
VLPNIDFQQWHQAFGQWIVGVTRFHHFESDPVAVAHQPWLPAAETTDCDIGKFFLARFYAAERGFHFCLEGRAGYKEFGAENRPEEFSFNVRFQHPL